MIASKFFIVLIIMLVLVGGSKIPELMKGMGQGVKEFRNAVEDDDEKPRDA